MPTPKFGTPEHMGKPWKKGQSGNPGGRPKGFGTLVRDYLGGVEHLKTGERMKRGELLVRKLYQMAVMDGNIGAARELLNRGFGMPTQPIEIVDSALTTWAQEIAERYGLTPEEALQRAEESRVKLIAAPK